VFLPWAPLVVALADPRPGERVLDIACGTGLVARLAAQRVGRAGSAIGLDLNPGMLAVAASITSVDPLTSAPITWREDSLTKMPFPDAAFDLAYCWDQFFPDQPAALREMYRILVSGGHLGLMVWRGIQYSPGFDVLAAAFARHVSIEAAGIMRAPFALAEAEELRALGAVICAQVARKRGCVPRSPLICASHANQTHARAVAPPAIPSRR
jgi:ubiquinone/menaquinone biosynthesis C-methylase UbiE